MANETSKRKMRISKDRVIHIVSKWNVPVFTGKNCATDETQYLEINIKFNAVSLLEFVRIWNVDMPAEFKMTRWPLRCTII